MIWLAVPRLAVIVRVVGTDLVPSRIAEHILDRHGDAAGASLDHVDQRAAVAVKDHLAVDPGLAVVETADRPDVQVDVVGGGSLGVVPAPLEGRLIGEHDDDRAGPRPHGDAVAGNARLRAVVDRFRLRPGLAAVGRDAGRLPWRHRIPPSARWTNGPSLSNGSLLHRGSIHGSSAAGAAAGIQDNTRAAIAGPTVRIMLSLLT